ncbi:MAG: CoA-binding protein [Ignavibacteria bacterium]
MDTIKEILEKSRNIAVIGLKDIQNEPAYEVPLYLFENGYKVFPVNPTRFEKAAFGENFVNKVTDLKFNIDLVNIFRRPEFLTAHAKEILTMNPPKYVWFQLGIANDDTAELLEQGGIQVVQNRCIMVEHSKLFY